MGLDNIISRKRLRTVRSRGCDRSYDGQRLTRRSVKTLPTPLNIVQRRTLDFPRFPGRKARLHRDENNDRDDRRPGLLCRVPAKRTDAGNADPYRDGAARPAVASLIVAMTIRKPLRDASEKCDFAGAGKQLNDGGGCGAVFPQPLSSTADYGRRRKKFNEREAGSSFFLIFLHDSGIFFFFTYRLLLLYALYRRLFFFIYLFRSYLIKHKRFKTI